jgi:hypothetical protein
MVKFKRFLMSLFFLGLIFMFVYGYVKVYTVSYNTTHRDKIVGWSVQNDGDGIHITVCGKQFTVPKLYSFEIF